MILRGDYRLRPLDGPTSYRHIRVALDATPLLDSLTGIGVFCSNILNELSKRSDIELHAFAVSWRRREGIRAKLPESAISVQRAMPARPLHAIWKRSNLVPLEWFIGDVDVVHGTNFVVPPTKRAATIVSVHDLTPLHYPQMCNAATRQYPDLIRRAIARGAWIHTDSEYVAQEVIEAFDVDPDKVRTVYLGATGSPLDSPLDSPPGLSAGLDYTGIENSALAGNPCHLFGVEDLIRTILPLGTTRYILAVGRCEPRKDLPGLVKAFELIANDIDDVALVLVGPSGWGSDTLKLVLEDLEPEVARRVVRTGWVDDSSLRQLLGGASLLAYPSIYEGFGLPPLEAMATGIPVVATSAGALPEILGDAAVLVPVKDFTTLANSLAELLDNEVQRNVLITKGLERAALFTWEACADGLGVLYKDVVDDHFAPRRSKSAS